MKMKLLGFVAALLFASVIGLTQLQSQAAGHSSGKVGNAPVCEAKAIGKRGDTSIDLSSPNAKHLAFSIKNNVTTVKFKVTGPNNCKVRLSANSFWAPTQNGKPYSKQILFERVTKVFTPGTHEMSVKVPVQKKNGMCYYQVDLTYGTRNITPVLAYGHGKLEGCKPPVPTPKQPGVSIQKLVDNVDYKKVNVDQIFTYSILVTNTGETVLKNVVVTDTPQAGVTLKTASVGTISNNTWTHTIPTLGINESASFTITASVPEHKAGKIDNTACVNAPEVNPNTPDQPDDCDIATVETEEPGNVVVCDPKTGKTIVVDEGEEDQYEQVGSPACKEITICVEASGEVKTIKATDYDPKKHSKTLSDCDEPEVPAELPTTGPIETILQLIGATSLAGAGSYYLASRRIV